MSFEIKLKLKEITDRAKKDSNERKRILALVIGLFFIFDYFLFCALTDKNVFDIVPALPVFEEKKQIEIYLPSIDAKTLIKETREVPQFENDERYIAFLFQMILKGGLFENTSIIIPADLAVRKIWIRNGKDNNGSFCIIDIEPVTLKKGADIIKGSEDMFKQAVEKTIRENIKHIKRVFVLDRGIPNRRLWEL